MKVKSLCCCVMLFTIILSGVAQQTEKDAALRRNVSLGFTVTPDGVVHHQGLGARAAFIEGALSHPNVRLLNLPYVPAGTSFEGWLRDGNIVVASTRVKTANVLSVDSFVVNPTTGAVIACLTCAMPSTRTGDFVYNEAVQPVYDSENPDAVRYYIFASHYGPLIRDDIDVGSYTQMWRVGPDGKRPEPLLEFHVGMHGCEVSPDGLWLACQPCTSMLPRPAPCTGPSRRIDFDRIECPACGERFGSWNVSVGTAC